jgi:redox-sensitive bicupin YhaK (pirin superfamily)
MTAGRGIIHSEMPQQEAGRMRGFQLWVNLPAAEKMKPAGYRDLAPTEIPTAIVPGGRVKVVAGTVASVVGPAGGGATEPLYFDVGLDAGASLALAVPGGHTVLAYAFEGAPRIGDRPLARGQLAVTTAGDVLQIAAGDAPARVLVIGGRPLREPVVHYGPFVMNTVQEIEQAVRDYQAGRLTAA